MFYFNNIGYLRTLNIVLAGAHFFMALILLIFALIYRESNFTFFLFGEKDGPPSTLKGVYLLYFAIFAMILAGGFYLFYTLDPFKLYQKEIENNTQNFRWLEFALTGVLSMIVISFFNGVQSGSTLIGIAGLVFSLAVSGLFSQMIPKMASPNKISEILSHPWRIAPFLSSIIFFGLIFLVLYRSYSALRKRSEVSEPLPTWIKTFFALTLVFYGLMALFPLGRWLLSGKEAKYEYIYGGISVLFRLVFCILICYGTYKQSKEE